MPRFKEASNATTRSIDLLKRWLSPTQLMEFERKRYFHVRGCDTGYKYRINYASGPFNVDRLDRLDAPVETYCFGPRGILWPGDIMLDQKIALETDETRTIKKIANARNVWMPWAALQAVVGNIVSVRATS